MSRIDYSDYIIHFTKGATLEDAFQKFKTILKSGKLNCGTGYIRGEYCCVCFTEAPTDCLVENGSLNPKYFSRYKPFGFLFSKEYIFRFGGRPVIYSKDAEFELLSESMKWRHVKFDPTETPKIDWTWEREWRLKCKSLKLIKDQVKLVLPDQGWITRLKEEHHVEQHQIYNDCDCNRQLTIIQYSQLLDEATAELMAETCPEPEGFPWHIINLSG